MGGGSLHQAGRTTARADGGGGGGRRRRRRWGRTAAAAIHAPQIHAPQMVMTPDQAPPLTNHQNVSKAMPFEPYIELELSTLAF